MSGLQDKLAAGVLMKMPASPRGHDAEILTCDDGTQVLSGTTLDGLPYMLQYDPSDDTVIMGGPNGVMETRSYSFTYEPQREFAGLRRSTHPRSKYGAR